MRWRATLEGLSEKGSASKEKRSRSISYRFFFRKAGDETIHARGDLAVVSVSGNPVIGMKAVPLPKHMNSTIEQMAAERLAILEQNS